MGVGRGERTNEWTNKSPFKRNDLLLDVLGNQCDARTRLFYKKGSDPNTANE